MMQSFVFLKLLVLVGLAVGEQVVIRSPNVTDFGRWGPFQNCSGGKLVTGFQLKVEPKHSLIDDTGLNGVRFFCGQPDPKFNTSTAGSVTEDDGVLVGVPVGPQWENVTSYIGVFGNWGDIFNCSTYAVGFDIEVRPPAGNYRDDVGATNMRLVCGDGRQIEGFNNNGQGHVFAGAEYTGVQRCPLGYAICGIQTQVESYQAFGDDTGLNNVAAKCCPLVDLFFPKIGR